MRLFAAFRAAALTFAVATSPALQATNPLAPNSCPGSFGVLAESKAEDWQPPQNIFGSSLPYLIPSAVGVLVLTQYFKHALLGNPESPVFSEAFPITIANDTLTTLTSHFIATSRLEGLKRFLDGRGRNGEVGFWRRAGANTALGTTLISLTWLGAGMNVGSKEVCGALALCAVVYPTLQLLKNELYKRLPLRRDVRELQRLEQEFPDETKVLRDVAAERAVELGVDAKEAEFLLLTALEAVVTNQPLETSISDSVFSELTEDARQAIAELNGINEELAGFGDLAQLNGQQVKALRNLVAQQRRHRRAVLNDLVRLAEQSEKDSDVQTEIEALLGLGDGVSPEFALALHKTLRDRLQGYRGRIALASVVDMSIAIGFFGGVCLEATNFWAKTGEIPQVLRLVAGG